MNIDLKTVNIKPVRNTFDNVAARIGGDKAASRYQEGTFDMQGDVNFHYRPYWDPAHEIHDPTRTAITMKDWYAFRDPRQLYYGTYTQLRARQQEATDASFQFVEDRGLGKLLDPAVKQNALEVLLPLRHVEWAANLNNASITAYGYGTAFTQAALFHSMDHLGMAQYLTRIGLTLADPASLDTAKSAWLSDARWQPLRKLVEDTMVIQDWFELFVAWDVALEGLLFPLVYDRFDARLEAQGAVAVSVLTRFMTEWFGETSKWVDAQLKVACAESPANKEQIAAWTRNYRDRAAVALAPVAQMAFGAEGASVLDQLVTQFNTRAAKAGVSL